MICSCRSLSVPPRRFAHLSKDPPDAFDRRWAKEKVASRMLSYPCHTTYEMDIHLFMFFSKPGPGLLKQSVNVWTFSLAFVHHRKCREEREEKHTTCRSFKQQIDQLLYTAHIHICWGHSRKSLHRGQLQPGCCVSEWSEYQRMWRGTKTRSTNGIHQGAVTGALRKNEGKVTERQKNMQQTVN